MSGSPHRTGLTTRTGHRPIRARDKRITLGCSRRSCTTTSPPRTQEVHSRMNTEPAREPTGASPALASGAAVPQLSADQFDRMTAYGVAQPVDVGDIVVRPGDVDYDLILVESGWIEILSPAIGDEPESVVARYGSGMFLGELNFLTGQTAYLCGGVSAAGRIHRISRGRFRRLMDTEPDLSDFLFG